jgi:hypothetical protein
MLSDEGLRRRAEYRYDGQNRMVYSEVASITERTRTRSEYGYKEEMMSYKKICLICVILAAVVISGCIPPGGAFYIQNGSNEFIEVNCKIKEDFTIEEYSPIVSTTLKPDERVKLNILSFYYYEQKGFDREIKNLDMNVFRSVFEYFSIDLLDSNITLTADDMKVDFVTCKRNAITGSVFILIIPAPEKRTGY